MLSSSKRAHHQGLLRSSTRRCVAIALVAAVLVGGGLLYIRSLKATSLLRPDDSATIQRGAALYASACGSCHGAHLEGQPNWQKRTADGLLPAPPHDASGHTWHHSEQVLFEITKEGMQKFAGPGYKSTMPAFAGKLSDDDIIAVLSFIKSTWSAKIRQRNDAASKTADAIPSK